MVKKSYGEYKTKGNYHKRLDKNWKYLPVYLEKIKRIEKILKSFKNKKILDAGCGEGVLVEKYRKKGFNIIGLDLNYSSEYIKKRDIKKTGFKDKEFDVVLCLDVLEHINISEHETVIEELYRITKRKGLIIFSLPNLAHFASRISFLFTGNLLRTSEIERHIGDRPIKEFISLIKDKNLKIIKRTGLFPTFPIISITTLLSPSKSVILHKIYNKLFAYPNWCFENIITTKKI